MEKRLVWVAAGAVAASLVAAPTMAQERDWYFGANGGQSNPDADGIDEETGWKAYAGYQFNPWFGAQIGYDRPGDFDLEGVGGDAEVSGWTASLVGSMPVNAARDVLVFAKVGAYAWEVESDADTGAFQEDDGTDPTFGVGAMYRFGDDIGVRVEWDRYQDVGGTDIDFVSAGISLGY